MIFIKEHLNGHNYEWNATGSTDRVKEMAPTRNRFDRFNGNSVLHMLNLFDRLVGNLTVPDAQQLETLITNELPLMLTSEISVFNWLKSRFIHSDSVNELN